VPIVGRLIHSARDGHSACVIHNRMYIFGGFEDIVKSLKFYLRFQFDSFLIRLNNFPMIFIILILINHLGIYIVQRYEIYFFNVV